MSTDSKERDSIITLQDFQQIKKLVHQNNRLISSTDKKQHPQFKNQAYINSSKTTLRNDNLKQGVSMQLDKDLLPQISTQCAHCLQWKKWAVQQQKAMLQLQNRLIDREMSLQTFIRQLQGQISIKTQQIQQFEVKCKQFSENVTILAHNNQILQEQITSLKQQMEKSTNDKITYLTPTKNDNIQENQKKAEEMSKYLKLNIENIQQEKKALVKASTVATKTMKDISNNQKGDETINKKLVFGQKKGQTFEQIRLQNNILKQYNKALLQQLKMCKIKKC